MFIDLIDDGWVINVDFKKKLFQYKTLINSPVDDKDLILNLQPVIEVRIKKNNILNYMRRSEIESELHKLVQSEEMKEIIDVASSRLKDYGLFIMYNYLELDYLKILIYKI